MGMGAVAYSSIIVRGLFPTIYKAHKTKQQIDSIHITYGMEPYRMVGGPSLSIPLGSFSL